MMRSSRSVLLSPPARWTTRRCWGGCECTVFDPVLTQNPKCDTRSRNKLPKKLPYPFGVILPQPASLVTAGWEACGTTWER